jgi:hypothetical protein
MPSSAASGENTSSSHSLTGEDGIPPKLFAFDALIYDIFVMLSDVLLYSIHRVLT